MEMYWEDYKIDDAFESTGRTMSDADIRMFIGATDATHPAHIDAVYSAKHPFGHPVVQGSLVIGVVDGFVVKSLVGQKVHIGHYGYDRIRFLQPVAVGDTLSTSAVVVETRIRNEQFGLITFRHTVSNQNGDIVASIDDIQMIERRA